MFEYSNLPKGLEININMRCIEILNELEESEHVTLININMRCIEIPSQIIRPYQIRLININMRCIEIRV